MHRQFHLHPSFHLAALLTAAHAAALAALFPAALPAWAKFALAWFVLFSLGYHLWRDAWLAAPSSAVALALDGDQAVLFMRNGEKLEGRITRDSLVTPWLAVLNILPQGARLARSAVILPDRMEAEAFRQLRVLLKWDMARAA